MPPPIMLFGTLVGMYPDAGPYSSVLTEEDGLGTLEGRLDAQASQVGMGMYCWVVWL